MARGLSERRPNLVRRHEFFAGGDEIPFARGDMVMPIKGGGSMCGYYGCIGCASHFQSSQSDFQPTASQQIAVHRALLCDNNRQADHNRTHFDQARVLVVNVMGVLGAGKTSLLKATILALRGRLSIAVIEGAQEAKNVTIPIHEAQRIAAGSPGRLDAKQVYTALHAIDLPSIDVLFIDNASDPVRPVHFDFGQHRDVVMASVAESVHMAQKYPVSLGTPDLVVLTKFDLLAASEDFDPTAAARELPSPAPVIELSSRSGQGMDAWIDWVVCEVVAGRYFPTYHPARGTRHHTSRGRTAQPRRAPGKHQHSA